MLRGMRSKPTDRGLDIGNLVLPSLRRRQTVLDVEDFVPEFIEPSIPVGQGAAMTMRPRAAMNEYHRRPQWPRVAAPGRPDVKLEFRPVRGRAEDHRSIQLRCAPV